jgi:hypothetical protein
MEELRLSNTNGTKGDAEAIEIGRSEFTTAVSIRQTVQSNS